MRARARATPLTNGRPARSVVILREPDETIIVEDGAEWVGFQIAPRGGYVTLNGARPNHLRSIPFWRVVSIHTDERPPADATD